MGILGTAYFVFLIIAVCCSLQNAWGIFDNYYSKLGFLVYVFTDLLFCCKGKFVKFPLAFGFAVGEILNRKTQQNLSAKDDFKI